MKKKSSEGRCLSDQRRFLAKARPEGLLRYFSNTTAFWRLVKATAVFMRQGLYFEVWGTEPELCIFRREAKSSVKPV